MIRIPKLLKNLIKFCGPSGTMNMDHVRLRRLGDPDQVEAVATNGFHLVRVCFPEVSTKLRCLNFQTSDEPEWREAILPGTCWTESVGGAKGKHVYLMIKPATVDFYDPQSGMTSKHEHESSTRFHRVDELFPRDKPITAVRLNAERLRKAISFIAELTGKTNDPFAFDLEIEVRGPDAHLVMRCCTPEFDVLIVLAHLPRR